MATPVVREFYGKNATNVAAITTGSISTSQTDWIALVLVYNENTGSAAATVSSVTSTGLAWALRKRSKSSTTGGLELWWAHGTGTLSGYSITVNMTGTYDNASVGIVFVSGCGNPTAPFDSNVSLPAALSAPTASWVPSFTGINTSNANDLLLFCTGAEGAGLPATGFSLVFRQSNGGGAWSSVAELDVKSVTAIQSSATFTHGSALTSGFGSVSGEAIFDALAGTLPPSATAQARAWIMA